MGKVTNADLNRNSIKITINQNSKQTDNSSNEIEIGFVSENIFRLTFCNDNFPKDPTYVIENEIEYTSSTITESKERVIINHNQYCISVKQNPLSLSIKTDDNKTIVSTPLSRTIDISEDIRFRLDYDSNERIYGLGQDPMAKLDHRDQERRMWQEWGGMRRSGNAGVPFYISSNGYGLLLNSSWSSRFVIGKGELSEGALESDTRAPAPWPMEPEECDSDDISVILDGGALDLYFILDHSFEKIFKGLNELTGYAPLLPKWMFGLLQSKYRYRSFDELFRIAKLYREKKIPCDSLIIDFGWFDNIGDLSWNKDFANAEENIKKLNDMGFQIINALHPYLSTQSKNHEEFSQKGFLNKGPEDDFIDTFDFTNPDTRKLWWEKCNEGIVADGVAGYWNDMGELEHHLPGTISYAGSREKNHNIYSTLWAKAYSDGQRRSSNKRVVNLMRTTYPGIQKYSGVIWSGDIAAMWDVLKDQIVIGQGVVLSGQNYWCTDIGGFFSTDEFDSELYIRWYQFGVFCPLFRAHARRSDNEAWMFGKYAEDIIKEYTELRYRLMPYIYSCARMISETGTPMMRAMCIDYGDDEIACSQEMQFMFGPAFLVAPIYQKDHRDRTLYLPEGNWYDFWTDKIYSGKQFITTTVHLGRIPLFVKAGSIIPMMDIMQHVFEKPADRITIHTYEGKSGSFEMYEDDGTSYDYENGAFLKTIINCDEKGDAYVTKVVGDKSIQPENREYIYHIHSRDKEHSELDIFVDHNLDTNGICTITATIINSAETPQKVLFEFSAPYGWEFLQLPDNAQTVIDSAYLRWKLKPFANAMPVQHEGELIFTFNNNEKMVRHLLWGSGFATKWSIISGFDNENREGGHKIYEPEINPDCPHYKYNGEVIPWSSYEQEYNSLGYVSLPIPDVKSITIDELCYFTKPYANTGYAKCKVWSDFERECYIEASGDCSLKIFINEQEIYKTNDVLLQEIIQQPVKLQCGYNSILLKVTLYEMRPYSGREFGFNFRFVNQEGEIIRDLLYLT